MWALITGVSCSKATADECSPTQLSNPDSARVKWVYDGDTLLLTDKRKIRIIGIDAPETKHHQQAAEAYAGKAREALRELLKKANYRVSLHYSKQRRDKYARDLAHVFLDDGTNLSHWLLQKGYARTLAIPPNVTLADCYATAEKAAQHKSLNIWQLAENSVVDIKKLPKKRSGYVRLKGQVTAIRHSKKQIKLILKKDSNNQVEIRINKKNLNYFKRLQPDNVSLDKIQNKVILVSGMLKNKYGKRYITINHGSQLHLLSSNTLDGKPAINSDNSDIETVKKVKLTIEWSQKNEN